MIFVYALRFASCNHNLIKPTATAQKEEGSVSEEGRGLGTGGVQEPWKGTARLDNISIGNNVVDVRAMCLLSSTMHSAKNLK